jgi:hypothetical protein
MSAQSLRFHPRGEQVPPGWHKVGDAPAHHARHSILIAPIERKVGQCHLLEKMGDGWISAQKLADDHCRDRGATRRLLAFAMRNGWVERRKINCPCCASSIYEYRKTRA